MPLTDIEQDIIYQQSDGDDTFIFNESSTDQFGAYLTNLYTTGGEFWLHNLNVSSPVEINSINDANSYVGWYHIRNGSSRYELIIPTRTADEEYTGAPLLRPNEWFRNNGYMELWETLKEMTEGTPFTGCTNPDAVNFSPYATIDDGSCMFVNHWLLGQIPPDTINNLFTEGGELYNIKDNTDYQGYYHVQGPSAIPEGVQAGDIMMGNRYWLDENDKPIGQPDNELLLPYNIDRLLWEQERGSIFGNWLKTIKWSMVIRAKANAQSLEDQNSQNLNATSFSDPYIIKYDNTKLNEREILIIDNVVTIPDAVSLMDDVDYQFNEIIPDPTLSPGIFGTKPVMKTDANILNLGDPLDGKSVGHPLRDKTRMIKGVHADPGPAEPEPPAAGA
jgi:hypothetical protein